MNKELIVQMQSQFDALARSHPDAAGVEFWFDVASPPPPVSSSWNAGCFIHW